MSLNAEFPVALPPGATDVMATIEAARERFSKAEIRVADYIVEHRDAVVSMSIGALAHAIGVSQPTIVRFCLASGFKGYKEFKLELARSQVRGMRFVHADVAPDDSTDTMVQKVTQKNIAALMRLSALLDIAALDQAADILARAHRIEFYGLGNSGIVAQDAQHKFFRLGVPTVAYSDPHVHGMAAALLKPGDAVVAISTSGRTADLMHSIETARNAGADVVVIAPPGSPVAEHATVAIAAEAEEDPDVYTPMSSRIVQLTVIDILSVAVSQRRGPQVAADLERAKSTLKDRRL
ncbi:MurR/RpiR family transcriptional regulator [Derxia gummosa]|uniref:MurR/RpiR family transcriptional regulator n=1 Tax=Derxia gummosa DSM 723 TaxID=1121388 RepID=A0A9U5CZJ2_9BURK|nr:MurR/RpiR family transcriptional regulator [Derxia gummosa]